MPGDASGPAPRPAWRGDRGGSARRGPRYAWKADAADPSRPPRRFKQVLYLLGAIGCVALIVVLVKLLQPPPRSGLVLVAADPAEDVDRLDVPLDVYGWQGGRQLAQWAVDAASQEQSRWGKLTPEVVGDDPRMPNSLRAKQFGDWAGRLADSKRDPLIVHFGLHGASSPDGPYLITSGGGRLPLREIIETFAGDRFRGRSVVLIFDPARRPSDLLLGLIHNDCVRGLKALEPAIQSAASNLVVLCGSDAGQRAWDSEEWRCGAFTHVLHNGLRGAAAPAGQTAISTWDLFDYARHATERWVGSNRPTAQTPILLPAPDAGGRERAAAIKVAVKVGAADAADPHTAPGAGFRAPDELIAHWQTCQRLGRAVPSPAVYTPRLWRRYRELLLRYERLVRADERPAASKLQPILVDVERELDNLRGLRADASAANALPLPAALGVTEPPAQDDAAAFASLWSIRKDAPARERRWEDLRTSAGANAGALRVRLTADLLRRAADSSGLPDDPDSAADLLRTAFAADPGASRPAEAQFLLMLRQFDWSGKKPPADLMRRAVAVRLLAERAALAARPGTAEHPYTEAIWPATRGTIDAADGLRRPGEDLLFAADPQWPEARKLLDAAAVKYDEALKTARQLQDALAVRDRALGDLPFLTRWRAGQRLDEAELVGLEDLWRNLDALDEALAEATGPAATAGHIAGAKLHDLTTKVRGPLEALAEAFERHTREARAFPTLQTNWRQIEQALAVPLIDPAVRRELLDLSRSMSAKFNVEVSAPLEPTSMSDDSPRAQAHRRGRLALAALGATLPDGHAGRDGRLKTEAIRALIDERSGTWEEAANRAGDQLWRHTETLSSSAGSAAADERQSRWAVAYARPETPEPAAQVRRQRWQTLLIGLARRTVLDHWYAETGEAYYRPAARRFLDDASRLIEAAPGEPAPALPGVAEVNELLKTPALRLEGTERLDWTSEFSRELDFAVVAPPALRGNGQVALWPSVATGALTLRADDRGRAAVAVDAATRRLHLDAPPEARTATVPVALHGYFRGQKLKAETVVALDRTPVRIHAHLTPPRDAGLAVRADDGLRPGAVAIVIDFSGSMAMTPDGVENWRDPNSKMRQALRVLEPVLLRLPRGTPLSIRIFGHLGPPGSSDPDPEGRRVAETRATPSQQIYKGEVRWSADSAGPLTELMARLRDIEPRWSTPLLRSMTEARDQDFPANETGPRTMLVLSDGADTSYRAAERVERIRKDFETAFGSAGVAVQIIMFRVDPREEADARRQFEGAAGFDPPGQLWMAGDPAKLAEQLDLALRPKLRLQESGKPVPGVPRAGLPANRAGDTLLRLRPSGQIAPRLYKALVFDSAQEIQLDRGDRLLVRLRGDARSVRFERDLWSDEFPASRRKTVGDWVLGVPQVLDDETRQGRLLRLMATLETTKGRAPGIDGVLQQSRPKWVWWEVAPAGDAGAKVGALRVTDLPAYPAPAWDLTVDDWPSEPAPRPVKLDVWCGDQLPPVARTVLVPPDRLAAGDFATTVELPGGEKVTVSAALESHPLRTDADLVEPPVSPCLVVRVRHAGGQPVIVHADLKTDGQEHRYYGASNYTGLFGPLTRDQLGAQTVSLALIPVNRLKEAGVGTTISLDLPAPQRGNPRPQPLRLIAEQDAR